MARGALRSILKTKKASLIESTYALAVCPDIPLLQWSMRIECACATQPYENTKSSSLWRHVKKLAATKNGDDLRGEVGMHVRRFAWCITKPAIGGRVRLPSNALCYRERGCPSRSACCSWLIPSGLTCSGVEVISPSAGGIHTLLPTHW